MVIVMFISLSAITVEQNIHIVSQDHGSKAYQ